jgi:aerotaxis receptor
MRVNAPTTNHEVELKDEDFLISRTDLQGKITYANPGFIKISGYSRDDLFGENHNIVRHPDMPAHAFADLWQSLSKGHLWTGIIKNRRKDGGFYWVRANVSPCYQGGQHIGYTSVRTKPSRQEIETAIKVYADLNSMSSHRYLLKDGVVSEKSLSASISAAIPKGIRARLAAMTIVSSGLLGLSAVLGHLGAGLADASARTDLANGQIILVVAGVLSIAYLGRTITKSIIKPIKDCIIFASQLAAGNLGAELQGTAHSDLKPITDILNTIRKSMVSIDSDINRSIDLFSNSASDIISGNLDLSARTEQQAAALQQTAASMEEITSTVLANSGSAEQATKLSNEAASVVSSSGAVMAQLVETMSKIITSSRKMSEHVETIDSIAFKTNILALNASVEAARAGEQGRGFAVVADEVRHLASSSAAASKEIRQLISESSAEIGNGELLVKEAEKSIESAVAAVGRVNNIITEISAASHEQSIGISQVNEAVAQMDMVTTQNAALVQDVSNISKSLEAQVRDVESSIAIFLKSGRKSAAVQKTAPKKTTKANVAAPASRKPDAQAHDQWKEF